MKKKFWFVLVVVLLVGSLAGCGGNKEKSLFGVWEGDVYTNETLSLEVTLPAGWKTLTDEQLLQANGLTTQEEAFASEGPSGVVDMFIWEEETSSYAMILVERSGEALAEILTDEFAMELHVEDLESRGYTIEYAGTQMFAGQEYMAIIAEGEEDVKWMHHRYFGKRFGEYAYQITIYVPDGAALEPEDLLTYFSEAQ